MIKNAEIVSEESREDEVGLNDTVKIYVEEDDVEETCLLYTSAML